MAVVVSITINNEGHPTTGAGDVLIGDRAENVADVVRKLTAIAAGAAVEVPADVISAHAEAIVDAHVIVAPGDPIPVVETPVPDPETPAEGDGAGSDPAGDSGAQGAAEAPKE